MAKRAFNLHKDRFWRDVLARFRTSRLSIREFCRQEKLREPLFYAWRRTIAQRDGKPVTRSAADRPSRKQHSPTPKHSRRPRPKPPTFLPLLMPQPPLAPLAPGMALELQSGHTLRLPESMPVGRLAELVRALETSQGAS